MNSTRVDELPTIERAERRKLAEREYQRLADQLRTSRATTGRSRPTAPCGTSGRSRGTAPG